MVKINPWGCGFLQSVSLQEEQKSTEPISKHVLIIKYMYNETPYAMVKCHRGGRSAFGARAIFLIQGTMSRF
jgi:hypothetical protein